MIGPVIWLLRHGDAEDGDGMRDADRDLTRKGERQARDAGRAMRALGLRPLACLASPRLRARRTAEIACAEIGLPVELDERLAGGGFDPLALAAGRGDVLLVGHEPDLSGAVAFATGARVRMRKGGLAGFDDRVLHLLMRPKDLREAAGPG